jgi:hypothetical protein
MTILEVFRCSCTERGRQCSSEFTRKYAFVPLLKTLERKNPGSVTLEVIAASAICPFHARILSHFRTDVVRMDEVLDKYFEPANKERDEERQKKQAAAEKERKRKRARIANSSEFTTKLWQALQK